MSQLQEELSIPDLRESKRRSIDWLLDNYQENETGTGWPAHSNHHQVITWGGTQDALRTFFKLEEKTEDPRIYKALDWLKGVQLDSGGWDFWEINRSSVESTCWCLITLKLSDEPINSTTIEDGVDYLISTAQNQENGTIAWGAFEKARPRVYPTLLASWALDGIRPKLVDKATDWLIDIRNDDSGWGFKPNDGNSNCVMTAMVIHVLRETRQAGVDEPVVQTSKEYILSRQNDDGGWGNITETFICDVDSETGEEVPTPCIHATTPWVIQALLNTDISPSDSRLLEAVDRLLDDQKADGSFLTGREDPENEYTWCLADSAIAIETFCQEFYTPAGIASLLTRGINQETNELRRNIERTNKMLKFNITLSAVLVLVLLLVASNLDVYIINQFFWAVNGIFEFLNRYRRGIYVSAVGALIISIGFLILNKIQSYLRELVQKILTEQQGKEE